MIYVNRTWNFPYSPRYHYCSVDLQNKIPINTTGIFFKNSHIQNLMVSENSIPHKRNSKKIYIFIIRKYWDFHDQILQVVRTFDKKFKTSIILLLFIFSFFLNTFHINIPLGRGFPTYHFSNNWIKNCSLIALIKQVANQLLTKNSKRLQIVRDQPLSCEDKLYTIEFT